MERACVCELLLEMFVINLLLKMAILEASLHRVSFTQFAFSRCNEAQSEGDDNKTQSISHAYGMWAHRCLSNLFKTLLAVVIHAFIDRKNWPCVVGQTMPVAEIEEFFESRFFLAS